MKITPVIKHDNPGYPKLDRFALQPELLGEYVPSVWRGKKLVAGALAAFVLGGTTKFCLSEKAAAAEQTQDADANAKAPSSPQEPLEQIALVSVAPIFVHGGGSGAEGCQVMTPPVFISEAEARKIITRELEKEKIEFEKTDIQIPEIAIDKMKEEYKQVGEDYAALKHPTGEQTTLSLDGFNKKYNLGYEFVSVEDFVDLGGVVSNSTVQDYDLKSLAEKLRDRLVEHGKMNVGVFYDPAVLAFDPEVDALLRKQGDWTPEESERVSAYMDKRYDMDRDDYYTAMQKRAEEELIAQVKDFIEWVKKEKILEKAEPK
jgi:hypothetical protein